MAKKDQLKALGITEPEYISEAIAPAPSYMGAQKEYEGLAKLEKEQADRIYDYEQENPSRTHKFMDALSTLTDFVEPGKAGAAKGASLIFGGLPKSSLKKLAAFSKKPERWIGALDSSLRGAQEKALRALRKGTEVGSPLRKGVLKDIEPGALLGGDIPGAKVGEGSGAIGRYLASGQTTPLLRKVAAEEQTREAFDAIRELEKAADNIRSVEPNLKAGTEWNRIEKELREEAKRVRKWHNRQMKLADKARKAQGPALIGTGGTPKQLEKTMFHETMHSAQTGGAPITRPLQTQLGKKSYPDWKPELEMALEEAGYPPEWARQLIEQEAWYLEKMAAGSGGRVGGFGMRGADQLPALYKVGEGPASKVTDLISNDETAKLQELLKLKPELFGALK